MESCGSVLILEWEVTTIERECDDGYCEIVGAGGGLR